MSINIIAAIGLNRELGFNNQLLCHLPNDLKHFKQLTTGGFVVMGSTTYRSIGKALPNRHNLVLTRNTKHNYPHDVYVYNSIEDILRDYKFHSNSEAQLWIIGGAEVYEQFLPHADKIHLTIIEHKFPKVDTFFPPFDLADWKVTENIKNEADENNPYDHYFVTYERKINTK